MQLVLKPIGLSVIVLVMTVCLPVGLYAQEQGNKFDTTYHCCDWQKINTITETSGTHKTISVFRKDGFLERILTYKIDTNKGEIKSLLKRERRYWKGVLIEQYHYNENVFPYLTLTYHGNGAVKSKSEIIVYGDYPSKPTRIFTTYFSNGQKRSEKLYVDDRIWGREVEYYINGNLKSLIDHYLSYSKDDGFYFIQWSSEGDLLSFAEHKDGDYVYEVKEDVARTIYNAYAVRQTVSQSVLTDSGESARETSFVGIDQIHYIKHYTDSMLHGTFIYYYPNKEKLMEVEMAQSVPHGEFKLWNHRGVLKEKRNYFKGEKFGTWTVYSDSGNRQSEIWYEVAGEFFTLKREWYDNGNLFSEIHYKDGRQHGLVTFWHDNGVIKLTGKYENGSMHGLGTSYYRSGVKKSEHIYAKGTRNGRATNWWENGQLKSQGFFKKNLCDSFWTFYTEDGKIETNSQYTYGHGTDHYNSCINQEINKDHTHVEAKSLPTDTREKHLISDLINRNTYRFYKEEELLKEHKWNFHKKIPITYPAMTDLKNLAVQDQLNRRIKDIILRQLETHSFSTNLYRHLAQTIATFNKVHLVEEDSGAYLNKKPQIYPYLERVHFRFLACHNSVVTLIVDFEYTSNFEHPGFPYHLNYCQIYYFNLENGKEFSRADVFKNTSKKKLINFLEESFKGELVNFSLTDGYAFPVASYMVFYIHQFNPCTQKVKGQSVVIRVRLLEIEKYLNPNGPFGSLIKLPQSNFTKLKNQNNPLFTSNNPDEYRKFNSLPNFYSDSYSPDLVQKELKTVSIYLLSENKLQTGQTEIKNVLLRQTDYLSDGLIKETREYQNDKIISRSVYSFDSIPNLVKYAVLKNGIIVESKDYSYDEKGNLLSKVTTEHLSVPETTYYHYAAYVSIEDRYRYSHNDGVLVNLSRLKTHDLNGLRTQVTYFSNLISIQTDTLHYDKSHRLLLVYSKGQRPLSGQVFVYDSIGRLVSYGYDRGRYTTEFKYDANKNLIEEIGYEDYSIGYRKMAEYDLQNRLIRISLSDRYKPAQTYMIDYVYW